MKLMSFAELIKPKQTLLLMITFLISFLVAGGREITPAVATLLTIAGTTALNMWLDRDIDAMMMRTRKRPLPSGALSPKACFIYGTTLFSIGLFLALLTKIEFAVVLLLGLFFDIIVYTLMLKRRSPYSVVIGGLAGAMPALAGWVAVQGFTIPGFLIASIVLLWIPSHIWFIAIYFEEDYRKANIPTFPLVFGIQKTAKVISLSTFLMIWVLIALYLVFPMHPIFFLVSMPITLYFLLKVIFFALRPEKSKARGMYKLASIKLGSIFLGILIAGILR
ncbi:MAG: protoheme IX farnesyltransferase [Archaeoglobales archaeon]|nr:protoheme IX farnesyltransferase [Archaeoglobales archaeon]